MASTTVPSALSAAGGEPQLAAVGEAPPPPLAPAPAAASTASGMTLTLPGPSPGSAAGAGTPGVPPGPLTLRARLETASETAAYQQLTRCFSRWARLGEQLSDEAVQRLARNEAIDPNDPGSWRNESTHAAAVLRRHGLAKIDPYRLTRTAHLQLIDGQRDADQQAGIDWTVLHPAGNALSGLLRMANAVLPLDLDDPRTWDSVRYKRAAFARRTGLPEATSESVSRWVLDDPDAFDAEEPSSWEIGTRAWLDVALKHVEVPETVMRPVGVFVTPDQRHTDSWRLAPVLSLQAVALIDSLGGEIDPTLTTATLPKDTREEFLDRVNHRILFAGPRATAKSNSVSALAEAINNAIGRALHPGMPKDRVERWGRLRVSGPAGWRLTVEALTLNVRGFSARRLGARRDRGADGYQLSVPMDLGEAVAYAIDREVPLLLSTEAAAHLRGTVRIGRMKGRPGLLTISESDGLSAVTRRVVADQALGLLRELKASGANALLDAGARQLVRMTAVRPLDDDPVLKDPQRLAAALKVVGSGLDMSQTATGKTITTGRAIYHRAARTKRFRALIIASPRLLAQWRSELATGAPERDLPALAPNCQVLILADDRGIGAQVRRFHRDCGEEGGVVLCSGGMMERYPRELAVIDWHLGVVDEIHRYRNPATEAHRALAELRFNAIADFWGLTGTPAGKEAANLDRLVGLCVGDRTLLEERLNTAEAGDLLDEINAARLRMNYGPHAIRVTKQEMRPYLPAMLPAEPMAVEADPALARLLKAAREGGEEAFRGLLEVLHTLKNSDKHSKLHRAAMKEFASKQGIVLGIVDTFVDIGVDPETLTHSNGLLAQALVREGLVHEAMTGGGDGLPLLRSVIAQTLAERASEEQMLIFAERVRCLHQLAGTLHERHGVEAHVAHGGIGDREFEELKRRFTAGEFPVLCLSQVGHEGHNLQVASGNVHLDVPPVPDGLEQRVGRSERIGSPHASIWTVIPYIVGAGTEHMVKLVAPRGGINHQILDAPEGVSAEESTIAKQLGRITQEVAAHKQQEGYLATAARLRVAARIFGAA